MRRALQFGIFVLAMALFGVGVVIIYSLEVSPAPREPAAFTVKTTTTEPSTTTTSAAKIIKAKQRVYEYGGSR
jgi:hypothetical protein